MNISGTIITNENGYGFRLPNGIIVNVMTNIGQGGSATQSGTFYYYDDHTSYTFPIPYVDEIPSCFGMVNQDYWGVVAIILRTKDAITRIRFIRPTSGNIAVNKGSVRFIAIGK